MTKTVYQTDRLGRYVAPTDADPSPLEPGVHLIPAGCVETPPPSVGAGNVPVWVDGAWEVMTISDAANGGPVPLEQWRKTATLSRMEMALALKAGSILTHAQAMELAGGTIPAPLAAFIALLPDQDSREFAEIATIAGQPFERASPLWAAVAAADTGPTEAEIDAIFGWSE